jgi:hypothetical protein
MHIHGWTSPNGEDLAKEMNGMTSQHEVSRLFYARIAALLPSVRACATLLAAVPRSVAQCIQRVFAN